jgi:hypothetical protein
MFYISNHSAFTIVVTLVYWSLLSPADEHRRSASNIAVHVFNSVLFLPETFIAQHFLVIQHGLICLLYGSLYYAMATINYEVSGRWVYPFFTWNSNWYLRYIGIAALFVVLYTAVLYLTQYKVVRAHKQRQQRQQNFDALQQINQRTIV